MQKHIIRWLTAACAVLLIAGVVSTRSASPEREPVPIEATLVAKTGRPEVTGRPFTISGDVTGLFPGVMTPVVVTVENPHPYDITVTEINVEAGNASKTCTRSVVSTQGFSGALPVAGYSTATTTVAVGLELAAPNACQGATFPLTYTGVAVRP